MWRIRNSQDVLERLFELLISSQNFTFTRYSVSGSKRRFPQIPCSIPGIKIVIILFFGGGVHNIIEMMLLPWKRRWYQCCYYCCHQKSNQGFDNWGHIERSISCNKVTLWILLIVNVRHKIDQYISWVETEDNYFSSKISLRKNEKGWTNP